jgi:hypothetical protein
MTMNDDEQRPLGMVNGNYFYQRDVDFAERMRLEYQVKAKAMLARADYCRPPQRGGYMAQARRAARDAARWEYKLELLGAHVDTWDPKENIAPVKLPEPDLEEFR